MIGLLNTDDTDVTDMNGSGLKQFLKVKGSLFFEHGQDGLVLKNFFLSLFI